MLSDTLPVFIEICRRSAKFILNCLNSSSSSVKFVTNHGINIARYNSFVGRNLLFCCDYFNWHLREFLFGNVPLGKVSFDTFCLSLCSDSEINNAGSLYEALLVREGGLFVEDLSYKELDAIINAMSTS